MWKSLLTFTVAALLTTPVFAQAEGKWAGKDRNGGTITAEFKVEGHKLAGTMTINQSLNFDDARPVEIVEISDGSMIADQVSFLITRGAVTERITGRVNGAELDLRRVTAVSMPPIAPPDAPQPERREIRRTWVILKRVQ